MNLPSGWRTGGSAALAPAVAVCAGTGLAAIVAVGFLHPGASGPVDGPVLLPVAILVAGVCGLAAFLVLRASTDRPYPCRYPFGVSLALEDPTQDVRAEQDSLPLTVTEELQPSAGAGLVPALTEVIQAAGASFWGSSSPC